MAYNQLKADIDNIIKANGQFEITGDLHNDILNDVVDQLGALQFKSAAAPATDPGTPDAYVWYITGEAGIYTNFDAIVVDAGEIVALTNRSGSWAKEVLISSIIISTGTPGYIPYFDTANTLADSPIERVDADNITIHSSVVISDNLIVNGDFITQNVEELLIADNTLVLNYGEAGAGVSAGYAGFIVDRGSLDNYALLHRESDDTGRYGSLVQEVDQAQNGGLIDNIILAATASAVDDFYNGMPIKIIGGTGAGQNNTITDYDGTTKTATVLGVWDAILDDTSKYEIITEDNTQALATREDSPNNYGVAFWNNSLNLFDTESDFTYNNTTKLLAVGNIDLPHTLSADTNGIIYKNSVRYIHNFSYGFNGTVTPVGHNIFMGESSGNTTMGSTATTNEQSSYNIGIGYRTLFSNTTGNYNVAIGEKSLYSNTTGLNNTAIGDSALYSNTTGIQNEAIGVDALTANTIGSQNMAIGSDTLKSNTEGNSNTAIGHNAMFGNVTGDFNTAIGHAALQKTIDTNHSIGIGDFAGAYYGAGTDNNIAATGSIYIGYLTKASASGNTNEIVIGYNAVGHGSNTVTLGNTSTTGLYIGNTLVSFGGDYSNGGEVGGAARTLGNTDNYSLTFLVNNFGALKLNPVASAVNYFSLFPSITTEGVLLEALGTDADIDINLSPKGNGVLYVSNSINIKADEKYLYDGVQALLLDKGTDATYVNTYAGFNAGNPGTKKQTAYGNGAANGSTAERQTAIGDNAGAFATGERQTAVGLNSGLSGTGLYQSLLGYLSGYQATGNYHSALGHAAGYQASGIYDTHLGMSAGWLDSGDRDIAIGFEALMNNTADNCIAIGYQALKNNTTASQFAIQQTNVNAIPLIAGDFSTGDIITGGAITCYEKSADKANPAEGTYTYWMSDGTGTGDDGDIIIKITAGGVTKTAIWVDFSSL